MAHLNKEIFNSRRKMLLKLLIKETDKALLHSPFQIAPVKTVAFRTYFRSLCYLLMLLYMKHES